MIPMHSCSKSTKSGRVTFLPVSSAKPDNKKIGDIETEKGFLGIAAKLVRYSPEFENIISGHLGRTAVVDSIDNAIRIARKYSYSFKIVTLDGEVLSPGGSVSGGSSRGSAGTISRNAEIERITSRIKEVSLLRKKLSSEAEKIYSDISSAQSEFDTVYELMWQSKSLMITEKSKLESLQLALKSETERISVLESETEKVNSVIESTNAANADMISGIEKVTSG